MHAIGVDRRPGRVGLTWAPPAAGREISESSDICDRLKMTSALGQKFRPLKIFILKIPARNSGPILRVVP
jgi:hypothetical protein